MNNEEERFDELLNSKLSEREFPFDELNWDDAEKLIIRQERWKKISRFFLTFSSGLAVGIVLLLPFVLNKQTTLPIAVVSEPINKQTPNKQSSSLAQVPQVQVKTNNANIQSAEKPSQPLQSLIAKKDNNTNANTISASVSSIPKKRNSNPTLPIVGQTHISSPISKKSEKSTVVASILERHKKPANTETIEHKETNPTKQIAAVTPPAKNTVAETPSTSGNNTETNKTTAVNTATSPEPINNNSTTSKNAIAMAPITKTDNEVANASIPPPKPKMDSNASNIAMPPGIAPPSISSDNSVNIVSAFAGANYSVGWDNNGTREANGITPWGGFDFSHFFTAKIAASLGIAYSELNNFTGIYSNSIVQYDFGATAHVTSVAPQKAYYIAIPVNFQWRKDGSDIFSIGFDYLIMTTTGSTLSTYNEDGFGGITEKKSSTQYGYTQGFSNSNWKLSLSYTRMLTDRIGLSAEFYHDFEYMENNTISGINQNAKNNGLRIVFSYQLIK